MADRLHYLEKRLLRCLGKTCNEYQLLAPGDRILVALSGGKDSYTLLHLLQKQVRTVAGNVELIAVHLDQKQPGYDGAALRSYLEAERIRFEILAEDTYSVVVQKLTDTQTYCSLCSRLRRGVLYTAAERLGCNKIALGHHRDDALETFLMNLFYSGKLQAMPALYTTDDGRFQVIRPLIECAESEIAEFAALMQFPILPCRLCGSQTGLKRDAVADLLQALERDNPHLRSIMLNALRNVRPTHLLDRDVAAAWHARPPGVRPAPVPAATVQRLRGLPIFKAADGPE